MTHHLLPALQPITSRVRVDATAIKIPGQGSRWTDERLTNERLARHITAGPGRGCCPIKAGESTTRLALLDLDSHDGAADWAAMARAADTLTAALIEHGLRPTPWRSSGGRGIHLIMLWDEPQDAYSAREHLRAAIATVGFKNGAKGHGVLGGEVEIFPKQDSVPADGYGNQFILPLHGQSTPLDPDTFAPLPQDAARALSWPVSDPVPQLVKPERVSSHGTSTALPELREALAAIPQETDPPDYDTWRNIVFAIHHETNGDDDGLALVHEFSARSGKYDPDLIDNRIWPYIRSDRDQVITGATITHLARTYGWNSTTADDFDVVQETDAFTDREQPEELNSFHHHVPFEQRPVARYLIKHWLPAQGVAVVYGASGSGKSFFTLDMVMAVVRDEPWHGHRVHGGAVAYLCAEGFTDFQDRVDAIGLHQKTDPSALPLYLRGQGITWLKPEKIKDLIRELQKIPNLRLLVIDTLAKVIAGENENAAEVMTLAVHHAEQIARILGILVLIVHHTGKDEGRGLRGHSALEAGIDSAVYVARPERGDERSGEVTKLKGGAEGAKIDFKLQLVSLNRRDEDGDQLFSCVIEECSAPPVEMKGRGVMQRAIIAEFDRVFDLTEEPVGEDSLIESVIEKRKSDGGKAWRGATVRAAISDLVKNNALVRTSEGLKRA